jgi:hypothetical protein
LTLAISAALGLRVVDQAVNDEDRAALLVGLVLVGTRLREPSDSSAYLARAAPLLVAMKRTAVVSTGMRRTAFLLFRGVRCCDRALDCGRTGLGC